jgi:hypothetical protein
MSAYQGSSADSSSSLIWDKNSDEKGLSMVLNSKEIQQNKNLFTEDEEFGGIVVDPLNFLQSDPGRIPDIKTTGVEILGAKTDDNPNGVNLVGKNGQVNDLNFYDTSSPQKITRKAGKVYVKYNYNETALVDRYKKSVEDNLVNPFTTSPDVSRINAISNNVFNYEMIPDADAANENGSPFSVNDQTKFQDSTLSYVRGLVPPPKEFVFDEAEYDGIVKQTATERKEAKQAGQEKINIQEIEKLKIPTISNPIRDRFAIAGVKPKINLKQTNELLRQKGFSTKMDVTDEEGKITVIKVTSDLSGKERDIQITKDTDPDTVKDLLKQIVTSKRPLPTKK